MYSLYHYHYLCDTALTQTLIDITQCLAVSLYFTHPRAAIKAVCNQRMGRKPHCVLVFLRDPRRWCYADFMGL